MMRFHLFNNFSKFNKMKKSSFICLIEEKHRAKNKSNMKKSNIQEKYLPPLYLLPNFLSIFQILLYVYFMLCFAIWKLLFAFY